MTLADELLPATGSAGDLLLRARALADVGDGAGALVTLFQTATRLRLVRGDRSVAREALRLLWTLPPDASTVGARQRLEAMLGRAR